MANTALNNNCSKKYTSFLGIDCSGAVKVLRPKMIFYKVTSKSFCMADKSIDTKGDSSDYRKSVQLSDNFRPEANLLLKNEGFHFGNGKILGIAYTWDETMVDKSRNKVAWAQYPRSNTSW
jgi:hypothetical protein